VESAPEMSNVSNADSAEYLYYYCRRADSGLVVHHGMLTLMISIHIPQKYACILTLK
jgi:hypothetical protein